MRMSTNLQKDVPNADLLILVQALNLQAMHKKTGSIVRDVATKGGGGGAHSLFLSNYPENWFYCKDGSTSQFPFRSE